MTSPRLALTVIGDEIGFTADQMISFCIENEVEHLDMRTVDGRNLLGMSLDDVAVVLHLTPGQDADIAAAPDVLALAPLMSKLLADKGYDGDRLRAEIVERGATPVIPNKSNRVVIHPFSKRIYTG